MQAWSHSAYEYTLNVDKEREWDLLDDGVYHYLFGSVLKSHIVAILAGPLCRTWSRLPRLEDNGPPPLQARDGPGRFGLEGLDKQHRSMVDGDTLLLLRTLVLMELMQAVKRAKDEAPGFVFLEHPADPATYTECRSIGTKSNSSEGAALIHKPPSIWSWPEVHGWLDRLNLHVARFDQGMLGHSAVKPTQVAATTSASLWESLNGRVAPLAELWHVDRGATMRDRVQVSRSHAAWAPQLVDELKLALARWPKEALEGHAEQQRLERFSIVTLSKVDKTFEWKRHCEQGHLPWCKDCLACLESAAYMRPHRRQRHPVLLNMMADLAGPYREEEDTEVQKGKYVLLVVYPFLVWMTQEAPADAPMPEDVCLGEAHTEEDLLEDARAPDPFKVGTEDEPHADPSPKERDMADKDTAAWASVVDALKRPYKVVN